MLTVGIHRWQVVPAAKQTGDKRFMTRCFRFDLALVITALASSLNAPRRTFRNPQINQPRPAAAEQATQHAQGEQQDGRPYISHFLRGRYGENVKSKAPLYVLDLTQQLLVAP